MVESAAGIISASLPTMPSLVKTCTQGFISTARSLSKSNPSQSGAAALSRSDAARGAVGGADETTVSAGEQAPHGNRRYELSELSPGARGSSHLKGKGWTIITTDAESEASRDYYP